MGIRVPFKEMVVLGGTSLTLSARAGESLRIHDIINRQASGLDSYLSVSIDQTLVRYAQLGVLLMSHTSGLNPLHPQMTIFKRLKNAGVETDLPIAEGQTLTITGFLAADTVKVIYSEWDAGDNKKTDANGSESKVATFIQYGTNAQLVALGYVGYVAMDNMINPSTFPVFPYEGAVPANSKIELLSIGAISYTKAAAGPVNSYTTRLRLTKNQETLFDRDKVGFVCFGTPSLVADAYLNDNTQLPWGASAEHTPPLIFPQPILFEASDRLYTEFLIAITGAGLQINAGELRCWSAIRLTRA